MKCLILRKTLSTNPDYYCYCEDDFVKVIQDSTQSDFNELETIEVEGRKKEGLILAEQISVSKDASLKKKLLKKAQAHDYELLFDDECSELMKHKTKATAKIIAEKVLFLKPVLIRFNDDCDGVSSGLLVKKALQEYCLKHNIPLELREQQLNSAIYSVNDYLWDSDRLEEEGVLFLLDLGANHQSQQAIQEATKHYTVVILDHHPFNEETVKNTVFLSPMNSEGTSSHTTGLLSYYLAMALNGKANEKLAWFSMQSDKSIYRKKTDYLEPVVIDYLTRDYSSLKEYEKVLESQEKIKSLHDNALLKMRTTLEKTEQKIKEEKINNALLVTVNLNAVKKKSYPPKSLVINNIHNKREEKEELVATVGHSDDAIQFRVSQALWKKGFKATDIIKKIVKEFEGVSGGGHEQAAAMRYPLELKNLVLEKTLEETRKVIKETTGKHA
ncbi:MAG: DHH family phosphoesterase [Candidatus Micrarchaeota archaeon]